MIKRDYSFIKSYQDFYSMFGVIARDNGYHPYNLEFINESTTHNSKRIFLKEPIFLIQWPFNKDSFPHQCVDIMIDLDFIYRKNDVFHIRSSVSLTYFKRNTQERIAEAFENLRFDFHPDKDDIQHPLIHAHVFASKKPKSEPVSLKNYTLNWSKLTTRLDDFRIPIPNMTLPSVLCCLVACHLGPEKLRDLLDRTREARVSFPGLQISEAQSTLFSSNSFAGSQWFERP